jgi:hypothetical protein
LWPRVAGMTRLISRPVLVGRQNSRLWMSTSTWSGQARGWKALQMHHRGGRLHRSQRGVPSSTTLLDIGGNGWSNVPAGSTPGKGLSLNATDVVSGCWFAVCLDRARPNARSLVVVTDGRFSAASSGQHPIALGRLPGQNTRYS